MAAHALSSCGVATLGFCGSSTARQGCVEMGSVTSFRCRSTSRGLHSLPRFESSSQIRNLNIGSGSRAVVICYADPSTGSGSTGRVEPQVVPRICTLKEFSEDDSVEISDGTLVVSGMGIDEGRPLIGLMAATVEATAQATDLETLSGRLAMVSMPSVLSYSWRVLVAHIHPCESDMLWSIVWTLSERN